jgi:hypothetical protein
MELEKKPDMMDFMTEKNSSAIRVPDLDWLELSNSSGANIPVPLNIEIIPQLQENWKRTGEASTTLIANKIRSEEISPSEKITPETIRDVVYAAKKQMMKGIVGKNLAKKLASTYPKNVIKAASEELKNLAGEQGLLGNVYIDISPFDNCEEASRVLGTNKIRLARYVIGNPHGHVCSSHKSGYCKELRKDVVEAMDYSTDLFKNYTTHLKIAGMIGPEDVVDSKEVLRSIFLRYAEDKKTEYIAPKEEKLNFTKVEADSLEEGFKDLLIKEATQVETNPALVRFMEVRPIMAFIQNEMLKGKTGNDLKESIHNNFLKEDIKKFAVEIKKVASLQGLLGNIYVDVSFYKDADEAIKAIKNAATNPTYLIQSCKLKAFDGTLKKVALNTGCEFLPANGKISNKIASSYLDDLQFTQRISSDQANFSRKRIEAGENVLNVLRESFLSSINYTPKIREGGITAHFYQEPPRKYTRRDSLKEAVYKSVEAGIPMDKIESKLIEHIPTIEAVSIVRGVLASVKEIDANVLTKCAIERYHFSPDISLIKTAKCDDCIMCSSVGCTNQGLVFAKDKGKKKEDSTKKDDPKPGIDKKTEKVLFEENPDIVQMNIRKEFDMPDYAGSNINVALDKMRGQDKLSNMKINFNSEGLDENLKNL